MATSDQSIRPGSEGRCQRRRREIQPGACDQKDRGTEKTTGTAKAATEAGRPKEGRGAETGQGQREAGPTAATAKRRQEFRAAKAGSTKTAGAGKEGPAVPAAEGAGTEKAG